MVYAKIIIIWGIVIAFLGFFCHIEGSCGSCGIQWCFLELKSR